MIWFLEGESGKRNTWQRIRMAEFPFVVGRAKGCSFVLENTRLSRRQAEFSERADGELVLRDLGSTNGTFVNKQRLSEPVVVRNGDVVGFAGDEYKLVAERLTGRFEIPKTIPGLRVPKDTDSLSTKAMHRLILDGQVTALFQPIVERESKQVYAYEMLGRGTHGELAESPAELFGIAQSMGLAVQLSELMRRVGVHLAHISYPSGKFFTNVHPEEMSNLPRLAGQIRDLRERYPALELVAEVHESTVAASDQLQALKDALAKDDVTIAYDDFGAGRARLLELSEVPPHYVKLDRSLVHEIHSAPKSRREMVSMVIDYCHRHEIKTIAEGVSGGRDAVYCQQLGIDYLQGYYFGLPEDLERHIHRGQST